MSDNEKRTERFTILLTAVEMAEVRRKAGLVAASVWARTQLLPGLGVGVTVRAAERETQKISKPGVEVEQRSVARRTGTIRAIEDLTHAVARKHIPAEEPKSGVRVCRHGAEQGAHCWQCRGIAEVEAPKKAKGRGKK